MAEPSSRTRVLRLPSRASYDREIGHAIIDAAPICHVSFAADGQPFAIPTNFARMGDAIVIHGSRSSRLLRVAASGAPLCLSFTILDALVLARSAFHHSVNYRSVVAFGAGTFVEDADEKMEALAAITNHLLPGRWAETRLPTPQELAATAVARIDVQEMSAKTRTGPPSDDDGDLDWPTWAGIVPLASGFGVPAPAEGIDAERALPAALRAVDR